MVTKISIETDDTELFKRIIHAAVPDPFAQQPIPFSSRELLGKEWVIQRWEKFNEFSCCKYKIELLEVVRAEETPAVNKTARNVIHEWGLDEEQYENTDALIGALDAAGFVIVPTKTKTKTDSN